MKLNKIVSGIAALGMAAAIAAPAHAGYVVMDGWQLQTDKGTTTNIGRLNLVSGNALVEQQTDGLGNVFVGAQFSESGQIFSISYTKENVVGAGDFGIPLGLAGGDSLTIAFSNVKGLVDSTAGAGFHYTFTSGNFLISNSGGSTASGSIIGLGGVVNSDNVIGGTAGTSNILAQILAMVNMDFKDSGGNSLAAEMLSGEVLFETLTNNTIANVAGVGACSFDATQQCVTLNAASGGDAYLVRAVPEPGSLALLGLGLLGAGALRRRKA